MGLPTISPAQVLHRAAKPITYLEFYDAVRATATPRFPHVRVAQPRRVALAISGGVDSMALAFLFNQLRDRTPLMRVHDNPMNKITAIVVDHGLRPESAAEAADVCKELRSFRHITAVRETVSWKKEGFEGDPREATNLESLARRARYRKLAAACHTVRAESLFLAHHQDDQYETVLMRLIAGHGSRGLRGMMPKGGVPECSDLHGVHESGHIDDQESPVPMISFRPPKRDWKYIRNELSLEIDWDLYAAELRAGLQLGWYDGLYTDVETDPLFAATASATAKARAAAAAKAARSLPRIKTEDAGLVVFRPLLNFSKDRLIATCESNNVRWFEDSTNKDRTLTMRNAVRYMVRNHLLPEALRKDNILRMSARCDAHVRAQEAEAERWVQRSVEGSFRPNAGTLAVRLPSMAFPPPKRRFMSGRRRRELRLAQRRTIAALVVRKLISFVSPEKQHAQLSALLSVVSRLFPALAGPSDPAVFPRKAFNQASVLFLPVDGKGDDRWYLVREPYPSNQPLPEVTFPTSNSGSHRRHPQFPPNPHIDDAERAAAATTNNTESLRKLHGQPLPAPAAESTNWFSWRRFQIWDGRFWIRVRGRVRSVFRVAPFSPLHAKSFREGLEDGDGEGGRARLEAILKRLAPGKVRYTLPALYAVNLNEETGEEVLRMLALPTLGIQLPGLERWVTFEVRYRKVDWALLDRYGDGGRLLQHWTMRRRILDSLMPGAASERTWRRRRTRKLPKRRAAIDDEIPLYN